VPTRFRVPVLAVAVLLGLAACGTNHTRAGAAAVVSDPGSTGAVVPASAVAVAPSSPSPSSPTTASPKPKPASRPSRKPRPAPVPSHLTGPATQIIDLAPVTTAGTTAPGWFARYTPKLGVGCSGSQPAQAAVSPNIYYCGDWGGPSYPVACWRSAQTGYMLCLRDPWSHHVDKSPRSGPVPGPVSPVKRPFPVGLELSDGNRCYVRNGGSWGQPKGHPELYGIFSCMRPGRGGWWDAEIWTTEDGYGINTTGKVWTVLFTHEETDPVTTAAVTKAYFVTTR